jgi:hypothetical protein
MSEVKVTNISLTIGKKELNLSIEDARKLQEALNQIFGNPTTTIYKDWVIWDDKQYDSTKFQPLQTYPIITCDASSNLLSYKSE